MQKLFLTSAIFWEKAQCVCKIVKTAKKRPFSLPTPQLDEATDHSGAPGIDAQTHLFLPWCHLSSLLQ